MMSIMSFWDTDAFQSLQKMKTASSPRLAWSEISALFIHLKVFWIKSKKIGRGQKVREFE